MAADSFNTLHYLIRLTDRAKELSIQLHATEVPL